MHAMNSEGGQFTVRGLLAIVTGCAILAAILRFSHLSVSAVSIGVAAGIVTGLCLVIAGAMFDSVERRAQGRWAARRAASTERAASDEPHRTA
jgi:hypothetical protein